MKQKKNPRGFARIQAAMLQNEAYYLAQVVLSAASGDRYFDSSFAHATKANALARLAKKALVRRNRRGFFVPTAAGISALRRAIWNADPSLTLEGE
jgi:hypothetical protein